MSSSTHGLLPELAAVAPELIIFDKGGTLIDFHGMWSEWVTGLARRLEVAAGILVASQLFHTMGFDHRSGRIASNGRLATTPMAGLRAVTVDILCEASLSRQASEAAVGVAWYAPDPVALAYPLVDLPALFGALSERGIRIAVVTMDDRAPTEATLAGLGVDSFVDALVCADDSLPLKPAPDMVWAVCRTTGVAPAQAVIVGDSVADLQMGQAAGVGLVIGVLSGVSPREMLAPHADLLLESVAELAAV